MAVTSHFSLVLETPAADPESAHKHFVSKLSVETDPADVHLDLERGQDSFVLVDVRSEDSYKDCHIPGAINIPYRQINPENVQISKDKLIIAYCFGPGCNASTKAAARFSAIGYKVKEMIGGLEYWRQEGYPVEGRLGDKASLYQ